MGMIINPYAFGVAQSYLLDTYSGAAVAYSLRKLSSTYTGHAIRVRRSSDNTEQNIGFDSNGNLDTTALTTFVGANDGFVTTWYDQSGNLNNVIQSTASNQAKIVSAGSVNAIVGTGTSHPCIKFNSSFYNLTNNIALSVGAKFTTIHSEKKYVGVNRGLTLTSDSVGLFTAWHYWTGGIYMSSKITSGSSEYINNNPIISDYRLISGLSLDSSANSRIRLNGSQLSGYTSGSGATDNIFRVLGRRGSSEVTTSDVQEFILYINDQSANISAIELNVNNFYGIY